MPVPILSVEQMREWERRTWAKGVAPEEVIARVGLAVARCVEKLTEPGEMVVFLAGKGHNGDDVRAALSHVTGRKSMLLNIVEPSATRQTLADALLLRPALLVDGLFGTGLARPLAPEWSGLIDQINQSRVRVLSVDVPSGVNADTGETMGAGIGATVTLTVGAPKRGFLNADAWPFAGRVEVATSVGLAAESPTSELNWTLPRDFVEYPPRRSIAGHKGTFGHVVILGGSLGFHGAAVLAARAAQRAHPGLVTVVTSPQTYLPVASQMQAVMVHPWRQGWTLPATATALVIGPGLAAAHLPSGLREMALEWWDRAPMPVVADASAIDWLPGKVAGHGKVRVITPHPGEAGRVLGVSSQEIQTDRPKALRTLSQRYGGCQVVLKGYQTLVGAAEGPLHVNCSGTSSIAQGGSGDALAGFLGGLLAQPALQHEVGTLLRYGVWQHGAAGDRLTARQRGWTVEELVGVLSEVRPDEGVF